MEIGVTGVLGVVAVKHVEMGRLQEIGIFLEYRQISNDNSRACNSPAPSNGGKLCEGEEVDTVPCNLEVTGNIIRNNNQYKYYEKHFFQFLTSLPEFIILHL